MNRLKSEMQDLLYFFKKHEDIKIRPLEEELGLANATIKLRRGYICPKHIPAIKEYLEREYNYSNFISSELGRKDSISKSNLNKVAKEEDNGVLISVYVLKNSIKIEINKI